MVEIGPKISDIEVSPGWGVPLGLQTLTCWFDLLTTCWFVKDFWCVCCLGVIFISQIIDEATSLTELPTSPTNNTYSESRVIQGNSARDKNNIMETPKESENQETKAKGSTVK